MYTQKHQEKVIGSMETDRNAGKGGKEEEMSEAKKERYRRRSRKR